MAADGDDSGSAGSVDPSTRGSIDREYVRRVYDRAIDWYKVAESKAQIILTVNGVLVTIFFGITAQTLSTGRILAKVSGAETWFFLARRQLQGNLRVPGCESGGSGHLPSRGSLVLRRSGESQNGAGGVHLARVVLRKHRFLNAGWALTAAAIVSLVLAGVSVFIRAQI
ncbi:hypothetical protein ABZX77_08285 [Streptomyces sp. NPDC004237]|uniref:hypothetical protein n=1 Tax=Streptomyces sp. NPDC004237 TaxID=3154455 RepID=UPI0033A26727